MTCFDFLSSCCYCFLYPPFIGLFLVTGSRCFSSTGVWYDSTRTSANRSILAGSVRRGLPAFFCYIGGVTCLHTVPNTTLCLRCPVTSWGLVIWLLGGEVVGGMMRGSFTMANFINGSTRVHRFAATDMTHFPLTMDHGRRGKRRCISSFVCIRT